MATLNRHGDPARQHEVRLVDGELSGHEIDGLAAGCMAVTACRENRTRAPARGAVPREAREPRAGIAHDDARVVAYRALPPDRPVPDAEIEEVEVRTGARRELLRVWERDRQRLRGHGSARLDAKHERSEEHTSELQSPCNLVCR